MASLGDLISRGREQFKPGDFVKHFKGHYYQIIGIGEDTETGKKLMIYKTIGPDKKIWVRPLDMFMSEVDHEKYPEVKQKYRFELVIGEVIKVG